MFERFTERACKAIVLAQEESGRLRHGYIGTEHLLLGLLREGGGVAAQALTATGVTPDGAREHVESIVGHWEEGMGARDPFTPRVNKVLQLAEREALQLDHDYISTGHVLLGLARESEGVAARVLLNLGTDPDAVRREIIKRLPDARDDFDPFDEAEWEMEGGEHQPLFRGRVGGIRAELALPRPLTVTVDADYSYLVPAESAGNRMTVEPADVADSMRAGLQEADTPGLETGIRLLGERLLDTFPAIQDVSVSDASEPPAPTLSMSATFRR